MGRKSKKKNQSRNQRKGQPKNQPKATAEPKLKKKAPASKPKTKSHAKVELGNKVLPTKYVYLLGLFLFGLAFLLNSNTFKHNFVLDDHGIIKNNKVTKSPFSVENTIKIFTTSLRDGDVGAGENTLYRPMAKLLFNAEWNAFDGNPHKFHVVNVLLFAILCLLIFLMLYDFFERKWVLPFLITLLFTVHPVHTEVVANIKSGDEILSLIGIVGALRCLQLYYKRQKKYWLILAALVFLIGLFSKESTVAAVAIFPFFIYYSREDFNWKKTLAISSIFLGCSVFFVLARANAPITYSGAELTHPLNNLIVMCEGAVSRFATAVAILGHYLKIFLIPYPLACDYSFSTFKPVGADDAVFLFTFLVLIGGFLYALRALKSKNKMAFGIWWFFITMALASNVFILIGTSFGERLLFTPSLGLSILFVCLLAHFLYKEGGSSIVEKIKASPALWGIILVMSVAFAFKTYDRNAAWKHEYPLFSGDLKANPNSAYLLFYMGNHLSGDERRDILGAQLREAASKGTLSKGSTNLNGAVNQNIEAFIKDSMAKESQKSISYFQRALKIHNDLPADGLNQYGKAYFKLYELDSTYRSPSVIDSALKYYTAANAKDKSNPIFINNIGTTYFQKGIRNGNLQELLQGLPYFREAHEKDSTNADYTNNIGAVYGMQAKYDTALYWFNESLKIDDKDIQALNSMAMTYNNLGNQEKANEFTTRTNNARMEKQRALLE